MENRNCLSYWFPRLKDAGLPVPHTGIVMAEVSLLPMLDGVLTPPMDQFLRILKCGAECMAKRYGWPVFLRTGQGSGKHQWSETCCLNYAENMRQHVRNLVEWSETVDILGLPCDVWAVREMLPVDPLATLGLYHGMPLVQEYRGFVKDGKTICVHPYWPEGALRAGFGRLEIPWVSRVIQGPVFIEKLITSHHGCFGNLPDLSFHSPSPTAFDGSSLISRIQIGGDFFRQLDERFGLTLLNPQIRDQKFTCLGGFRCVKTPVIKGLPAWATWWNKSRDWPSERLSEDFDGPNVNLCELDFPHEEFSSSWPSSFLHMDRETPIGIQHSRTIRDGCFIVFHTYNASTSDASKQAIMTVIPDTWIANTDLPTILAAMAKPAPPAAVALIGLVANAFRGDGAWSVDVLKTRRGYYVTDMAEAHRSFHWEGCEHAQALNGGE